MEDLREKTIVQSIAFKGAQIERLSKLRLTDGASVSEHVRRALDMYLDSKGIEV